MRRNVILGLVLGVLLALPAGAAAQSRCTALQYKLAAKAALAKAKCKSIAVKRGEEIGAKCVAKAEAALARKWADAEAKGDCIASVELGPVQDVIDAFLDGLMDVLEPPASTAVCCEGGGSCWHGSFFTDAESCVQFGTTAGAPGTVCDASTGTCRLPPVGTGQCCFLPTFTVCSGGPALNLQGCVASGGLDFPFAATCAPNGGCTFQGP